MIRRQGDVGAHETAAGADVGPVQQSEGSHGQHGSRQEEEGGRVGAAECLVQDGMAVEGQPLTAADSVASSLSSLGDCSHSVSVSSLGDSTHGLGPRYRGDGHGGSFVSWVSDTWSAPVRHARRRRYWARKADLKLAGWLFACGLLWEITAEAFVEMANHSTFADADDHTVTIIGEYVVAVCGMGVIVLIKNRRSFVQKARSVHDRNRRAWRRRQQEQQRRRQREQTPSGDLLSPLVAGAI